MNQNLFPGTLDQELERIVVKKTKQPRPRPEAPPYGFGQWFTDHMFSIHYDKDKHWHSPSIAPYANLSLDPGASVLHYGQALFEGIKAFYGEDGKIRIFRPRMNWERMQAGSERLCMEMLDLNRFLAGLVSLCRADRDWVPKGAGHALYLRPTLIGTEAFLGVRPAQGYMFYVIASPVSSYYQGTDESVRIWIETEYSRSSQGGIGEAKAGGNYACSLLAAKKAKERGYSQVLWLDSAQKKYIEEVGTMNVFFLLGDTLVTPPLKGTILPGVTRDSVIALAHSLNIRVEERPISIDEVVKAHQNGDLKEVFGTGTAAAITPVGTLGLKSTDMQINGGKQGPIAKKLGRALTDIYYGRVADTFGWTLTI